MQNNNINGTISMSFLPVHFLSTNCH